jgi:hypothetical protein
MYLLHGHDHHDSSARAALIVEDPMHSSHPLWTLIASVMATIAPGTHGDGFVETRLAAKTTKPFGVVLSFGRHCVEWCRCV